MHLMQEFEIDRSFVNLMKVCLVVFVALLALSFALPFLPEEKNGNPAEVWRAALICIPVFGFLSAITWNTLRKLPNAAVAADNDGIWRLHIGKIDGLIPWEKISVVKESAYLQRLNLFDQNGEKLLTLEYQLVDFEDIRYALNEKAALVNSAIDQSTFSKGGFYHVFYLAGVIGFAALGLYVGINGNPVLGYGGMTVLVAMIIREYCVDATGVNIGNDHFEIVYPFSTRTVLFSEVEEIYIGDEFQKGQRTPGVLIAVKNAKKPFKLKQLNIDSNALYRALKNAIKS